MIKKLARHILRGEIKNKDERLNAQIQANLMLAQQNRRLEEIVNTWDKEDREQRDYQFSPTSLTNEEQEVIGKYIGSPLVELITKWFKSRADQNNDMLIHNVDASSEKKSLWRIAVLTYEDWYMFMKNCGKMAEREESRNKEVTK